MVHASLRMRLTLMVLLAIVPSLLLALLTGLHQRTLLMDHARAVSVRLAKDIAEDEGLVVDSTRRLMASLAMNPVVLGDDPAACGAVLADMLATDHVYTNLTLIAPNGEMICGAQGASTAGNVLDRVYFQRVLATGQFAIGDYVFGRITGQPALLTGYPILDETGAVRAVLHAGINLSWVAQATDDVRLPPGSHVTVVRRDGTVLERYPDAEQWRGQVRAMSSPLAARIQSGRRQGVGEAVDDDGVATLYAFRVLGQRDGGVASDPYGADTAAVDEGTDGSAGGTVSSAPPDPTQAVVVITVPVSAAMAEADDSTREQLLALAAVALLGIGAAWFGGEAFLLRRVRSLAAVAERVTTGDLTARARSGHDSGELGALAGAFDRMTESLQRRSLEREEASRALAESEARYRAIVEEQTEWIVRYRPDLTITFVNGAYSRHLGRSPEELIGTSLGPHLVQTTPEAFRERLALLTPDEPTRSTEDWTDGPDGSRRWEQWTDRAIFDAAGRIVEYQSVGNDVTARRQAEAARNESDTKRKLAADALVRQDRLLSGVAAATNQLLVSTNFASAIGAALATLGETAGVDRVRIIESVGDEPSGTPVLEVRFEWATDPATECHYEDEPHNQARLELLRRWCRALAAGRPIRRLSRELPRLERDVVEGWGMRSVLAVPIHIEERFWGCVGFDAYDADRVWTDSEVSILGAMAGSIGGAIARQQTEQAMQAARRSAERESERLRTLADLAQVISSTLDTADVLREIARSAARLMDAPLASFFVVDEKERRGRGSAFSDPAQGVDAPYTGLEFGVGCVGWVAETREHLDVPDVFQDGRITTPDWWRRHDLRSFYGVPVLHEQHLLAVLGLYGRAPFSFDAEDRDLLEIFVGQVATAFRNASLFEAVAQSNRALETSVRRANELAEVARAASRAKSDFLSRMSHELRTPMNAILGFAQLLELGDEGHERSENVDHILKAGQHLLGLINEVLDISRIESGRLHLSVEPVDACAVSEEIVDLVRPLAEERRVGVQVDRPSDLPTWIMADHQRLKQVITNLLTNGVKYNRPGGQVTISFEMLVGYLRIAVRDTGVGIERDKIGRLFDPFDRLDADLSGIEGTGLGLTISRSLAEAMGGSLTVESFVGQGSTFWLDLPTTDAPPDAVDAGELTEALAPAGPETQRHVVLYVEDNAANRVLIQRILDWRPGIDLVMAPDGQSGLALARERHPSLVLLDLHLPDVSGREVLETLRRDPDTADVPVVVLSADASPGQIQRLLSAGAHSYLTKPIVVRELLDTLDTILEQAA